MDQYLGLFLIVLGTWFIPPLILFVIGRWRRKISPNGAKRWYIAGVVWLLIGGGICATLLT
jgi:hypothetical protein